MKRDFNELMLSLKKSITPADFFVDFPKVYVNIKEYELHLNILNTLIGKENIEEEFADLIRQYPEVMRSIPILLATHEHKFNIKLLCPNNCFHHHKRWIIFKSSFKITFFTDSITNRY